MKHLLQPQLLYFFRNLPCRRSFVLFPKTIPSHDELTLERRIERVQDSTVAITPLLREWCERGNQTTATELRSIIESLYDSERYSQALQVSDWMSKHEACSMNSFDFGDRLELISEVHGIEEAAKFLKMIPLEHKGLYVYLTLLDCCEEHKSLSIAQTTFQKMRDLFLTDNLPNITRYYIIMLSLYKEAKDHDMVVKLLRDMFNKKIQLKQVPFDDLLFSYYGASVMDVEGMEKFLSEWEKTIDEEDEEKLSYSYFPGLVYIEAGYKEKGLALLRKTEQLVDDDCRELLYRRLMTEYCDDGTREDVYRLCNLAKHHKISFDSSTCSSIIKALTKISDLDKVLEDWDEYPNLDMVDLRPQNSHVKEEAEKVVNMIGKKESKLETLARKLTNLVEDEDDKEEERRKIVEEAMEGRLHDHWDPKSSMALSAYTCVQYVEGRRDMESAADILRLLNKQGQVMHAMDKDRLSLKMVETMRGGGYIGGED
ncbi:Pentatricopeptide repeat-containing protein [Cardamine amara subsp. amara]|uniref:Pentatricopeptide repeat-containing protein n=1 Tax=Cardamine amara subsp. amara TaxID=228776 RepID=A0ABD1BQC3_CARAN